MATLMAAFKAALKTTQAAELAELEAAANAPDAAPAPASARSAAAEGSLPLAGAPPPTVEELELGLLLQAIALVHGYDYQGYLRPALWRKLHPVMARLGARSVSALQDLVLHQPGAASAVLRALYVEPASMFDDPQEVSMLRVLLGASLRGAPLPRVWLADCAGAQQAWTTAILLEQEQLGARTEIYATVASDELLAEARQATLPLERLGELQGNYLRSGGTGRLLDYFDVDGNHAVLRPDLAARITWAQYNLVTDASFNEFQLIVCRRALADFGPTLRSRVLRLLHDSLAPFGVLGLDRPLDAQDGLADAYRPVLAHQPWYKRVG
ncbi:CheR family methyltransferase [Oxalobacteraceae bacterium A2-2]